MPQTGQEGRQGNLYGNIVACLGRRWLIPIVIIIASLFLFSLLDFYLNYAHTTHARPEWILQASNDLRLRQVCLHAMLNLFSALSLFFSLSLLLF